MVLCEGLLQHFGVVAEAQWVEAKGWLLEMVASGNLTDSLASEAINVLVPYTSHSDALQADLVKIPDVYSRLLICHSEFILLHGSTDMQERLVASIVDVYCNPPLQEIVENILHMDGRAGTILAEKLLSCDDPSMRLVFNIIFLLLKQARAAAPADWQIPLQVRAWLGQTASNGISIERCF